MEVARHLVDGVRGAAGEEQDFATACLRVAELFPAGEVLAVVEPAPAGAAEDGTESLAAFIYNPIAFVW